VSGCRFRGYRNDRTDQEVPIASSTNQKSGDALTADATAELISSEKVEGTAVYDRKGDKIGSVHHLMINKYTGQVAYAVVSFGGFLGIGAEYYPIPWRLLDYEALAGRGCAREGRKTPIRVAQG
jgi:sporulation protein YlmC with PRC-barrel domain